MTRPPLLLAAHGTRDQAGVDAFAALAARVAKLAAADGTRVAGGFIEAYVFTVSRGEAGCAQRARETCASGERGAGFAAGCGGDGCGGAKETVRPGGLKYTRQGRCG